MRCVILFLVCLISCTYSSNILVMLPYPLYSHTNSYMPIFTELAKRGHNVTVFSPYPLKEPIPNFNEIIIEDIWKEKKEQEDFDVRKFNKYFLARLAGPWIACSTMIDRVLNSTVMQKFLNDTDSKFDMVITESFFCQEPFLALGYKYGALQVSIQTISLFTSLSHLIGNPHNPSYIPNTKLPLTNSMNFLERSINTLAHICENIINRVGWMYMDYAMRTKFIFPGFENLPPLVDIIRNISLILVDNHNSLIYPRPYLPNVVEFGILTIKEGAKLPDNLEKFMNESEHGVVYFSWGSHYKTNHMPPETISVFMTAFGKLKQRVLMKADQETLPNKPDNVMLAKWLPQASILAHPKTRVFVSHGGLHGFAEAVYHGVPILGTPLFSDQQFNLRLAEEYGFCLNVDIDTVTEEILSDTFQRLLTNSSYKENIMKRSEIMKDRPLSALDNAVYWVEYMLRHKGAPHLRSTAPDLYWFQYFLLDVIVVWGAVFIVSIALLGKLFKKCCCLYRKKKMKKE